MALENSIRRCWAEIDLAAVRHNVDVVHQQVGDSTRVMAVIKANAYGHGLVRVARELEGLVEIFGVANLAEADRIRDGGVQSPIFILGPALPEEREAIIQKGYLFAVSSFEEAREYSLLALDKTIPIHIALDTGMGRMGIWQENTSDEVQKIAGLPGLQITGIATHLPVADEDEPYTEKQLEHFESLLQTLSHMGIRASTVHVLNSVGILRFPKHHGSLVRAGLMLYGCSPLPELQDSLIAPMTLKTRITLIRDVGAGRSISYGRTFVADRPMRVATLAIGYADGYARHLSGRGAEVLIGGKRCPVLGRVTMDQIMVDVTSLNNVTVGDEVVVLGRQGNEEVSALELARKSGTIPWEIFTGIGSRVARVYINSRFK